MDLCISATKVQLQPSPKKQAKSKKSSDEEKNMKKPSDEQEEQQQQQPAPSRILVIDAAELLAREATVASGQSGNGGAGADLDEDEDECHDKEKKKQTNNDKKPVSGDDDDDRDDEGQEDDDQEAEEETFAENCGSAADREFDDLIGAIETFIVSDELRAARDRFYAALPLSDSIPQQEHYMLFKKFEQMNDELCDEWCRSKFPGKDVAALGELIASRADEVSDDVMEVIGGGLDFSEFMTMWKLKEKTINKVESKLNA